MQAVHVDVGHGARRRTPPRPPPPAPEQGHGRGPGSPPALRSRGRSGEVSTVTFAGLPCLVPASVSISAPARRTPRPAAAAAPSTGDARPRPHRPWAGPPRGAPRHGTTGRPAPRALHQAGGGHRVQHDPHHRVHHRPDPDLALLSASRALRRRPRGRGGRSTTPRPAPHPRRPGLADARMIASPLACHPCGPTRAVEVAVLIPSAAARAASGQIRPARTPTRSGGTPPTPGRAWRLARLCGGHAEVVD